MTLCLPGSRILVTGAHGFLGRHLVKVLQSDFTVIGFDVQGNGNSENFICGSVTDPAAVRRALQGVDGVVMAHMAPNLPGVYDTPELPFEVNVKGTAHVLQAAAELGVRRHVVISSVSVVDGARRAGTFLSRDLPPSPVKMYGLTMVLQEAMARYYHERHGLEIALLRPAYVILGDSLEDKYGVRRPTVNWQAIDPRDIGRAAAAALSLDALECEVFYVMAGPDAPNHADVPHTAERLHWEPRFRFLEFPRDL